ncbi:hypothetical protein cce_0504 [Crocosphaera subtropica ATCC 51142]|uniref:Uncharacterized protein n=1 Tax=Crocosphaera subtropica (strain ATCC 51142 / BH68) TaxID=43989 RepID=B1WP73_CROS5|nr:hypothetical protein [Crocosphaera subtropica]ACB49855.1 hypothetical protein cce_0504 [Crocosphaera subtropica ATCC 51142]
MKITSNIIISAPHIVIPQTYWNPLLGEVLRDADLITEGQLQIALRDKQEYKHQKIGEILALRGWIKQETVDFFAEEWANCLQQGAKYPIGQYLRQAALLDQKDIENILDLQQHLKIRFGEIAVSQGLLTRKTLNFFLNNLLCQAAEDTLFVA